MAEEILVFNARNTLPDTIQSFFDAEVDTQILAFTASNNSAASVTFKAYIFSAAGAAQAVIPQKIVVRDRFDLGPSIVGFLVPKDGSLRMETSTAEALSFNVVGQEII